MNPALLGRKYDKIAKWWQDQHHESAYGVSQIQRALRFASDGGNALDVGCGVGGRFVRLLDEASFSLTGLDVSEEMIRLARANHPKHRFLHQDICDWETQAQFDFIVAWDSIFHVPWAMQRPVLSKLCRLLADEGVLIYTFGNAVGEHVDTWRDDTFYYSSIGIAENLKVLLENDLSVLHLELDQYPENHVYAIAQKPATKVEPFRANDR